MQLNDTGRLSTLIVDDEPLAREGLRMLLDEEPEVSIVLQAANGHEAVGAIRERRPDLVFLDIQMPEMDGFSVVREIGAEQMPLVVFVTAHDQYAIQAFEINAIDYLLKPVTRERFSAALQRARTRLRLQAHDNSHIVSLLENIAAPSRYLRRLAIRTSGKTSFVNVADIDWIRAAENYVQLHTGSQRHLLHVPIGTLEASLDPQMFLRIHRSLIVNTRQILEIESAQHGEFVFLLQGGARLHSSRTYCERIRNWAKNPF
jgi:two-component system LytT family response regulator